MHFVRTALGAVCTRQCGIKLSNLEEENVRKRTRREFRTLAAIRRTHVPHGIIGAPTGWGPGAVALSALKPFKALFSEGPTRAQHGKDQFPPPLQQKNMES